jgi:hypothetical protein
MNQDYRQLTLAQHEDLEKQTLRCVVQAVQEYSREAKVIFDNAPANWPSWERSSIGVSFVCGG